MRLAFLGSPSAAVVCLDALAEAGHEIVAVVTQADKRRGRRGELSATAVKTRAVDLGLPVYHSLEPVTEVPLDLGVVVAYGRIIPGEVLRRVKMLNVHFSLLPRWRGAAPVERAIMAGDEVTGVSIMELDEGLDTGPVLATRTIGIGACETVGELTASLAIAGAELIVEVLAGGAGDLPVARAQAGEATYAAKLESGELEIDWSRDCVSIARLVRLERAWTAFRGRRLLIRQAGEQPDSASPEGGRANGTSFDRLSSSGDSGEPATGEGRAEGARPASPALPGSIEVFQDGVTVQTGSGRLKIVQVQGEGRDTMAAVDWARGARIVPGERLGA